MLESYTCIDIFWCVKYDQMNQEVFFFYLKTPVLGPIILSFIPIAFDSFRPTTL